MTDHTTNLIAKVSAHLAINRPIPAKIARRKRRGKGKRRSAKPAPTAVSHFALAMAEGREEARQAREAVRRAMAAIDPHVYDCELMGRFKPDATAPEGEDTTPPAKAPENALSGDSSPQCGQSLTPQTEQQP